MAPLPDNNTARFWLDYTTPLNQHSLMVRYSPSGATLAEVMAAVDSFLSAIEGMLNVINIAGARASAAGSEFSFPVLWTGAATYGSGALNAALEPRETRWLGRDNGGRRVSWSMYGCNYDTPSNYRLDAAEFTDVGAGISAIEAAIVGDSFLTINYGDPIIYPYASVNFNSYWERQARG